MSCHRRVQRGGLREANNAVADEKRGLVFLARVRSLKDTIQVEQKYVRLPPSMAVTVEIKTGERWVVEYFLSPLMQADWRVILTM